MIRRRDVHALLLLLKNIMAAPASREKIPKATVIKRSAATAMLKDQKNKPPTSRQTTPHRTASNRNRKMTQGTPRSRASPSAGAPNMKAPRFPKFDAMIGCMTLNRPYQRSNDGDLRASGCRDSDGGAQGRSCKTWTVKRTAPTASTRERTVKAIYFSRPKIPKPDGTPRLRSCISCVNFVSGEKLLNPNGHELLTDNPIIGEITGINVTNHADEETERDATCHKSAQIHDQPLASDRPHSHTWGNSRGKYLESKAFMNSVFVLSPNGSHHFGSMMKFSSWQTM